MVVDPKDPAFVKLLRNLWFGYGGHFKPHLGTGEIMSDRLYQFGAALVAEATKATAVPKLKDETKPPDNTILGGG